MVLKRFIFLSLLFVCATQVSLAQEQIKEYEYFKKVPQLREALRTFTLDPFLDKQVLWVGDSTDETVASSQVNKMLRAAIKLPKKFTVAQASETNHGYAQTFGFYDAEEVAIYFVSFRIKMDTQKIEEIRVVAN